MIVDVININSMTVLEAEGYSPVARHRNGIVTPKPSCKCMQPESQYIHIAGRPTLVEHGKDSSQFSNVVWRHSPRPTAIVECLEAPVLER